VGNEEIEIRRAPKVLPWMITGGLLGALVAVILYLLSPGGAEVPENFLGLMVIALSSLGLGLGVGFAIIFDLVSSRRAKRAVANRVIQ
jgi:hypothetical protein